MIKDMVMYLLRSVPYVVTSFFPDDWLFRQGCYSQEGDIVVLCAYLGQLARVRDALASQVAVVIDDRDQMALVDQETEKSDAEEISPEVEHVKVSKRVSQATQS